MSPKGQVSLSNILEREADRQENIVGLVVLSRKARDKPRRESMHGLSNMVHKGSRGHFCLHPLSSS